MIFIFVRIFIEDFFNCLVCDNQFFYQNISLRVLKFIWLRYIVNSYNLDIFKTGSPFSAIFCQHMVIFDLYRLTILSYLSLTLMSPLTLNLPANDWYVRHSDSPQNLIKITQKYLFTSITLFPFIRTSHELLEEIQHIINNSSIHRSSSRSNQKLQYLTHQRNNLSYIPFQRIPKTTSV